MLILSHVAVEFYDPADMSVIFNVGPLMINQLIQAPDALKKNEYFKEMVAEGSIEVPNGALAVKNLEMEPVKNTAADGKRKNKAKEAKETAPAAEQKEGTEAKEPSAENK